MASLKAWHAWGVGCGRQWQRVHPASCHVVYTAPRPPPQHNSHFKEHRIPGPPTSWDVVYTYIQTKASSTRRVSVPFHRSCWSSFHVTGVWFPWETSVVTNSNWPHPQTGRNHAGMPWCSSRSSSVPFLFIHYSYYLKAIQLAPKSGRPYNQLAVIAIKAVSVGCYDDVIHVLFMYIPCIIRVCCM